MANTASHGRWSARTSDSEPGTRPASLYALMYTEVPSASSLSGNSSRRNASITMSRLAEKNARAPQVTAMIVISLRGSRKPSDTISAVTTSCVNSIQPRRRPSHARPGTR